MKNIKNFMKDVIEFLNGFKNMINDLSTKGRRIKQIPNLLTLSRLGFALIIPPIAMTGGLPNLIAAAILTIIAELTDGIDGFVARKLDAVSEFGKNLDPVCDKIFAGALLLPLIGKVSPLLSLGLCANVALELGIAGVNLKSKAKGNVPRTTILGKFKTVVLSTLIASLYVSFSYPAIVSIIPIVYALATTTQAITLIDYQRIDRKKDNQMKVNTQNEPNEIIENPDNSDSPKIMNKGVINHSLDKDKNKPNEESAKTRTTVRLPYEPNIYSSEDFRRLKDEVIRTKTTTDDEINNPPKTQAGFQKTK